MNRENRKSRRSKRRRSRRGSRLKSRIFNDGISDYLRSTVDKGSKIISTNDNLFTRYYFVTVDPDVIKDPFTEYDYVSNKIQEVIHHPKGWTRFGYKFHYLEPQFGIELRKNKQNWHNVFWIRLSSANSVEKTCGFLDLSCADLSVNVIYLNDKNWVYSTAASGLSPTEYQYQLCGHEIAHLLNKHHPKQWPNDPNKPCSILHQQTVKPSRNSCYPNIFPLDDDNVL